MLISTVVWCSLFCNSSQKIELVLQGPCSFVFVVYSETIFLKVSTESNHWYGGSTKSDTNLIRYSNLSEIIICSSRRVPCITMQHVNMNNTELCMQEISTTEHLKILNQVQLTSKQWVQTSMNHWLSLSSELQHHWKEKWSNS